MSSEEIHAKVARTRAEQGLPPAVTDPATLERVAAVFRLMAPADQPAPPKLRKRYKPPGARADLGGRPAA